MSIRKTSKEKTIGYFWKGKGETYKAALYGYNTSPYAFHPNRKDALNEFYIEGLPYDEATLFKVVLVPIKELKAKE